MSTRTASRMALVTDTGNTRSSAQSNPARSSPSSRPIKGKNTNDRPTRLESVSRPTGMGSTVKNLSAVKNATYPFSSLSDTPASPNVAISARSFTDASAMEIPSAAPVPSPSLRSRSSRGRSPMCRSIARCPGSTET